MNHPYSLLVQANHFACPLPENLPGREALSSLVDEVETREPSLLGHGARTAWYALEIGQAIYLSQPDLEHLKYAAYLHDVGKLSISPEILTKPQPLSSHEYQELQSHPRAALSILDSWPFLKIPSVWIAHHHERWDGSGYPYGLKGELIPLGSRIIAIADTFDVLTIRSLANTEPGFEPSLSLLRWYSGSHFDPGLVETFSKLVPQWAEFTPHPTSTCFSIVPYKDTREGSAV